MPDFWPSCRYRLLTQGGDGRLTVTDDFLRSYLTRTELAPIPQSCAAELVATMKAFNDVKEKDVVTLDFVEGATKIGLNGAAKGSIAGEPFNRALTKIWLGDHPIQADLKRAMLGG